MIFVNKGIETDTQALTLEIIADTCGSDIARAATFIVSHTSVPQVRRLTFTQSGPSFASESWYLDSIFFSGLADKLGQLFADNQHLCLLPR